MSQSAPVLPHIDDVSAIDQSDSDCLEEVRQVLARRNKQSRFGVLLLHQHFPVSADEVLLEECDEANRTLTIKPVKRAELSNAGLVETNWRLDIPEVVAYCQQVCQTVETVDGERSHSKLHDVMPG